MKIQTDTRDGVVVLKPIGRIVGPASDEFKRVIFEEMKGSMESPNFLFDFADVSRIDSVGIGVLTGLHVSIAHRGGQVGVINISDNISSTLVMAKLITIFKHFKDENEAIANLQGGEGD